MNNPPDFEVYGINSAALFTLKIFRGENMVLLGMNWKNVQPPANFVGFAIEYCEPGGTQFYAISNRLSFLNNSGNVNPNILSTRLSPIQKFRWIHFPYQSGLTGYYTYRVTPVFMDTNGVISYGDFQEAAIQLQSETYPGVLNVAFTRGFVASQAFVDRFQSGNNTQPLLPGPTQNGLTFTSANPQASVAYDWMGFEARKMILNALDQAIADTTALVRVTAYDLDEPEVLGKLHALGTRLKIIIDNSGSHGDPASPEAIAENMLVATAGRAQVQRQKVGGLQHNKTIAVIGTQVQLAIGGSTNFSWRGFFIQNNNAVMVCGAAQAQLFFNAFDSLFVNPDNPIGFEASPSANWTDLSIPGLSAKIAFSPHNAANACLKGIADDMKTTTSSLLYSLAFLYQTQGVIKDAIVQVTNTNGLFVYGISDKDVGGLDLQAPNGNPPVAYPATLLTNVPEPFKAEVSGGGGVRMHHKFVVIDFDEPTARVYMGSYNFSQAADLNNGENLWCFRDRRIAVSYMIEAVAMFDHYEWRDAQENAKGTPVPELYLHEPPKIPTDQPWWAEDYTVPEKIHDRVLFSS